MKTKRLLLVLALPIVLSACQSVSTRTSYDSSTDFRTIETFGWSPDLDTAFKDSAKKENFIEVLKETLESKGLRYDDAAPDVLIRIHRYESYREEYAVAVGGRVDFGKRMLRIDFIDPSTGRSLLEVAAVGFYEDDSTLPEIKKVYRKGIGAMFERYPPAGQD